MEEIDKTDELDDDFVALLQHWTIETPNIEENVMMAVQTAIERAENREQLGAILAELKAMRRDITYLREEVATIQRERRREREPVYGNYGSEVRFREKDNKDHGFTSNY
jgi:hypothetical protein